MSKATSKKSTKKAAAKPKRRRGEPVALKTPDFLAEQADQIRQILPHVFTEGKIDVDKLRATLGDSADERPERYSFGWAGKRAAIQELQKPTKTHLCLSWAYAAVSIIAAVLSMCFLIPEVKSMMQPPQGFQNPETWHPEYWRIAVLIASALFCVWVVRILVRLLLSNIHLLTDARERVTMVQTYLALMRRGKLKDDERMFILQTLFRPTPTGIVKDDAVPLTIVEGITKLGR